MEKLKKIIYSSIEWICIFMLVIMTATVLLGVVGRALFKWMPAWNEELSLLCLTWISLLGATLADFSDSHIRITVLETFVPMRIYKWFNLLFYIIKLAICAAFFYFGILQVKMTIPSTMVSMPFSQAWRFLSGVIFALFTSFAIVYNARRIMKDRHQKEEQEND